jgi:hypothetical protein
METKYRFDSTGIRNETKLVAANQIENPIQKFDGALKRRSAVKWRETACEQLTRGLRS